MNNTIKEAIAQKLTFSQLLADDSDVSSIEIPMIQRDYAQGRTTEKESRIRENFLNNILNAIENHRPLTLDFVYGNVDQYHTLIPLDGQQRLTTLFLLHWYASRKEGVLAEQCAFLHKFTYFARPSSRDFCQSLSSYHPTMGALRLSDDIKNQSWFQYGWGNDPTISGMLVMIDAIAERFAHVDGLWHRLTEENIISFYFLSISNMGLTDELYVKMNSRGRPLTAFEHFKAEFEGMIAKRDPEASKRISNKFDHDWTDMLFPYRGDNQIIDDEFMNYYFFLCDIIRYKEGRTEGTVYNEFDLAKQLFEECDNWREHLQFMEDCFDCWCNLNKDGFSINDFLNNIFYKEGEYQTGKVRLDEDPDIFCRCLNEYLNEQQNGRKMSLDTTLLLYAVIVYLRNRGDENITDSDFRRRIRIIRNLIHHSKHEMRVQNMPELVNDVECLITAAPLLPDNTAFNKMQMAEEIKKSAWLHDHIDRMDSLYELEDHPLLYGCVSIIGLQNDRNFRKFGLLFDSNFGRKSISRAMLCYDWYGTEIGPKHLLGTHGSNTYSWKELFQPSGSKENFERTSEVLNHLLDSLTCASDEELQGIISRFLADASKPKDMSYYMVKYPVMLSDHDGYYYKYDDEGRYNWLLLNRSQLNGKNWDVFMLALHEATEKKYTLEEWAYQGLDGILLAADTKIVSTEDGFAILRKEGDEWAPCESWCVPQAGGIDTEDRIEMAVHHINNRMF